MRSAKDTRGKVDQKFQKDILPGALVLPGEDKVCIDYAVLAGVPNGIRGLL